MAEKIYLCLAHMSDEGLEQKYIKEAFDTNWVVPLGPNVDGFEEDLEKFVNRACNVKPGDEVLTQSFTFCASAHSSALQAGICRNRRYYVS